MPPEEMQSGGQAGGGFWNNTWVGKGLKGYADGMSTIFGAPNLVQNSIVDNNQFLGGVANGLGNLRSTALSMATQGALGNNQQQQMPQQQYNPYTQMGYNPQMMGGMNMGGMGMPGFGGGMMQLPNMGGTGGFGQLIGSLGSIAQLMQSLGGMGMQMQKGGGVRKYQTGGLVDIQAERGELIHHPTGYLTKVHAKKLHSTMEKSGEGDKITDHPLDGSYILSDYLKIKKSDADDMVIGVKRFPYEEGKSGKEPILYTLGDLFSTSKKKMTPAEIGKKVSKVYKVSNDRKDIFNILGDQLNLENRKPYLEALTALSEVERERDDMMEGISQYADLFKAKKGGRLKSRRIYQSGGFGMPFGMQYGMDFMNNYMNDPNNYEGPPRFPSYFGGTSNTPPVPSGGNIGQFPMPNRNIPNPQYDPRYSNLLYHRPQVNGVAPVDSGLDNVLNNPPNSSDPTQQVLNSPLAQQRNALTNNIQDWISQMNNGNYITQYQNVGSPFLRGFGQAAMPIGAGINTAANVYGAIGSYNLNSNLINENKDFFNDQRGLVNRGRNISSMGTLFNMATQQQPEDLPLMESSRLRQYDPQQNVNVARQMGNQGLGEIRSLIRNNPAMLNSNIGSAVIANNQNVANARIGANNQQLDINKQLDSEDFQNNNIVATNRQRMKDFTNNLSDRMNSFFTNESSRQMDIAGLNSAERQADIAFRQNRLQQPIAYASAAGNSLSNAGAAAYGMGNQYVPQQIPAMEYYLQMLQDRGILKKGGTAKKKK